MKKAGVELEVQENNSINKTNIKKIEIPVWEKINLTINEASEYSNIGLNKIREMTYQPNCSFVLFVGKKRLIKRKSFEQYLEKVYKI